MIKIICFLASVSTIINSYSQKNEIDIIKDNRIDVLVKKQGEIIPPATVPQITGYRIQLFFDTEKKAGITSTKIKQYQETLLVYNGLKGFKQQDGKCQIGLSMHATDANGKIILEEADLLKDQELEFAVFSKQFISTFNLGNQKVVNPIRLEVFLWDKLGNARIRANIDLDVE